MYDSGFTRHNYTSLSIIINHNADSHVLFLQDHER